MKGYFYIFRTHTSSSWSIFTGFYQTDFHLGYFKKVFPWSNLCRGVIYVGLAHTSSSWSIFTRFNSGFLCRGISSRFYFRAIHEEVVSTSLQTTTVCERVCYMFLPTFLVSVSTSLQSFKSFLRYHTSLYVG